MSDRVLGLDGFKKRWVGVTLLDGRYHSARVYSSIREALTAEPEAAVVAIDVPIGFPDGHGRPSDHAARKYVGARHSSVFLTFPEAVLAATTHAKAAALAKQLTGKAITQQSYALRAKVLEAADAAKGDPRLVEVHPEVSFCALAGGKPLAFSKKTWNGLRERRCLLKEVGIAIPEHLPGAAGAVPADDIMDAAVAAWSARRVAQDIARVLPAATIQTKSRPTGVIWY